VAVDMVAVDMVAMAAADMAAADMAVDICDFADALFLFYKK